MTQQEQQIEIETVSRCIDELVKLRARMALKNEKIGSLFEVMTALNDVFNVCIDLRRRQGFE